MYESTTFSYYVQRKFDLNFFDSIPQPHPRRSLAIERRISLSDRCKTGGCLQNRVQTFSGGGLSHMNNAAIYGFLSRLFVYSPSTLVSALITKSSLDILHVRNVINAPTHSLWILWGILLCSQIHTFGICADVLLGGWQETFCRRSGGFWVLQSPPLRSEFCQHLSIMAKDVYVSSRYT